MIAQLLVLSGWVLGLSWLSLMHNDDEIIRWEGEGGA